jgi:spore maturation protein SpmB
VGADQETAGILKEVQLYKNYTTICFLLPLMLNLLCDVGVLQQTGTMKIITDSLNGVAGFTFLFNM